MFVGNSPITSLAVPTAPLASVSVAGTLSAAVFGPTHDRPDCYTADSDMASPTPMLTASVLKKNGAIGTSLQRQDRRESVGKCIAYIKEHPDQAVMLWLVLQANVLPQLAQASVREPIPPCTTHLAALSVKVTKTALMKIRSAWDRAKMKLTHEHDSKQLYQLMYFAICETDECRVHQSYADDFLAWFEARSQQMQRRLRRVIVEDSGQVAFEKFGEYALVRAEGCTDTNMERATHLQHIATKLMVELDTSTCFTSSGWALKDNWSKYDTHL